MAAPPEQLTDTRVNVVDYFKPDAMGRTRRYVMDLASLDLDNDLVAHNLHAEFRIARAGAGVIAEGTLRADIELECVRTLDPFVHPLTAEFTEQFRPTIDLATGRAIAVAEPEEDPDYFPVDDSHHIDLREALRQVILVNVPMQPVKPGTEPVILDETEPDEAANPFAALGLLLQEEHE